VAADGWIPTLVPQTSATTKSRRLHMIATAALDETVITTLVYARYGFEYVQQTPDRRIALGGFSDLDGPSSYTDVEEGSEEVWDRLAVYLHDDLGLSDSQITHRWVGIVGFSEGDKPFAGQVREGLYALGGYSGHGNLIGFIAGRGVAEHIATGASSDLELLSLAN